MQALLVAKNRNSCHFLRLMCGGVGYFNENKNPFLTNKSPYGQYLKSDCKF